MVNRYTYGYKHWTLEDPPRCFNVGKGLKNRSSSHRGRNHKWRAIVKRYGLQIEVCVGFFVNEDARIWEIENIELMGTFSTNHSHDDPSDIGCNLTKGGEGGNGWKVPDDFGQKISKSWTEGRRLDASLRMLEDNPMKNPEISGPVVEKLIAYHTGRKRPEYEIEKLRESKRGPKNPAYGKPQPEEAKRKNAESNRKRALAYWAKKRAEKQ